ncbi:MAG: hypothetical protein KAT52_01890 [Desulfobacterales bacterium]|nr:hypothetical protein [Desulfobacterales bacterium]
MDAFINGLLSSISANLITTVILLSIALLYVFTRGKRRGKLLSFLGLSAECNRLIICTSSYLAHSIDPVTLERLENKIRSAMSVNEFSVFPALDRWVSPLTKHSSFLEYLIHYIMPSLFRFIDINVKYIPSPSKTDEFNFSNCTLILIGGPVFNQGTMLYYSQNMCSMQLLTLEKKIAVHIIKGKKTGDILGPNVDFDEYEVNGEKDIAIIEKIHDRARNINVIIAAGATSQGTKAAIYHLINNWTTLYGRYKTNPFAICLECDNEKIAPNGFLDSTILQTMDS